MCQNEDRARILSDILSLAKWNCQAANKDVLQVLRALLLEYDLDAQEWPYLLPVLQGNLNHTPVHSLGGHAPVELFTGLPASSALDTVITRNDGVETLRNIDLNLVSVELNS